MSSRRNPDPYVERERAPAGGASDDARDLAAAAADGGTESETRLRCVLFYHSLVSDWNHGNAHFLRGVVRDLLRRGHQVTVWEPRGAWSRRNLVREGGRAALAAFRRAFPELRSRRYELDRLDLDRVLDGADLVLVHEWSDRELVRRVGRHRRRRPGYRLFFHDTHHRSVTDPEAMAAYDLSDYDGVLAFGEVIRRLYLERGWAGRAWTWHEAADVTSFRPRGAVPAGRDAAARHAPGERELSPPLAGGDGESRRDLVWVGNWGDEERTAELEEFLIGPVSSAGLRATVHGVRYPEPAQRRLAECGIEYRGWLANHEVPAVFAAHRMTVHVPRRPYVERLPGIPTIRVFEALACGIPLVCSAWEDSEGLFRAGRDYLLARSGGEMTRCLRRLRHEPELRWWIARNGLDTVLARHTCTHRVDELLALYGELEDGHAERGARRPRSSAAGNAERPAPVAAGVAP